MFVRSQPQNGLRLLSQFEIAAAIARGRDVFAVRATGLLGTTAR